MKRGRRMKIITAALGALLCLAFAGCACAAWDSEREIMRLKGEVPSMEIYSGNDAVIWLRNDESRLTASGSVERLRATVIMMGEKVPESWKTVRYPVPTGGSLTVEEAAWYNTMTGMKEGDLSVENETLAGGATVRVVTVPEDTIGRAVVIVTKEIRESENGVSGTVNMAGDLPIWEQNVSVEVPEGTEIFWSGREMREPAESMSGGSVKYSWQVMNQLPWLGEGFVVNERPMLSFSTKVGVLTGIREADALAASMPQLPMPSGITGDARSAGGRLIAWVNSPERTLAGYQAGWVRGKSEIPADGPWTPWEQTFLLHKWLTELGWDSKIWWNAKMYADSSSPAAVSLFESPVLELKAPGASRSSYFAPGIPYGSGRVPLSLAGTELYGDGEKEHKTKKLSDGSASASRLALLWRLKLTADGRAAGTLEVTVTGGWNALLSGLGMPTVEDAAKLVLEKLNFAMLGMSLTPLEVKEEKDGYNMKFNVSCTPGIIHGGSMLLRLPGGVPMRVSEMIGREDNYTLRFPFIIDQKVRMSMPSGFRLLQEPALKQLGEGSKAVLRESITHWPKRGELLADSLWVVKTREVEGITAQLLKEELAATLRWPVLDLPFRK